jgi:hypothetical protein
VAAARSPIDLFHDNLAYARNLLALARAVDAQTTPVLDMTDVLRASLVAGVSALDHFVHEKVRVEMLRTFTDGYAGTEAFGKFEVSMSSVRLALSNPGTTDWLDQEIRRKHSLLSFQKPDKIADAIRLCGPERLWQRVASTLGADQSDVKRELILIVDRRNKIVHEADMDPTPPHDRWPIDSGDVDRALAFIDNLVGAIDTA